MSAESKPRRRWPRVLLLQFVVLVVGLALAEGGFRLFLRVSGDPYDAGETRAAIQAARSRAVDLVPRAGDDVLSNRVDDPLQAPVLHPYTGYVVAAKLDQLRVEMTRLGVPENDDDFEILVVGGSVADIFGHLGVPRMVETLAADPRFVGRRIYVYCYGVGGFKQPQMAHLVDEMLALGFTPECVLDVDGFNEVALARANADLGTHPLYPSSVHWASLTAGAAPDRVSILSAARGIEAQAAIASLADRVLGWGGERSALIGTLALRRLEALATGTRTAFETYARDMAARSEGLVRRGPPFVADGESIVRLGVKSWEEGSRTLRGMCAARGILYLHVLQPTMHDVDSKPLTKREIATGGAPESWLEGVRIGYPLLRLAGSRLAAEGEHFVDATRLFATTQKTLYFDNCHFNEDGNRILGEHVARALLAILPQAK